MIIIMELNNNAEILMLFVEENIYLNTKEKIIDPNSP